MTLRDGRKIMTALLAFGLLIAMPSVAFSASRLQFDPSSGRWVKKNVDSKALVNVGISRRSVPYESKWPKGTIVIDTATRSLHHIQSRNKAIMYRIGVGRQGFTWKGKQRISRKEEWPTWTPPAEMRAREAKQGNVLPVRMAGGPENPLGARALYLGNTLFRIHGTNQPQSIGRALSSGCIRMTNNDVVHLFDRVRIGTLVVVN